VPWAGKMEAAGDEADIVKTNEKHVFFNDFGVLEG
jgi:hypothetical protein